jgi:hypothetical protein
MPADDYSGAIKLSGLEKDIAVLKEQYSNIEKMMSKMEGTLTGFVSVLPNIEHIRQLEKKVDISLQKHDVDVIALMRVQEDCKHCTVQVQRVEVDFKELEGAFYAHKEAEGKVIKGMQDQVATLEKSKDFWAKFATGIMTSLLVAGLIYGISVIARHSDDDSKLQKKTMTCPIPASFVVKKDNSKIASN